MRRPPVIDGLYLENAAVVDSKGGLQLALGVKLYLRMQMQVVLSINCQTTEAAVLALYDPGSAST